MENMVVKGFPNGVLTRRDISLQLYHQEETRGTKKSQGFDTCVLK